MKSPLSRAALICLPVLVVLAALATWNPRGNFWTSVEPPKAQCEAYDSGKLRRQTALSSEIYDQIKLDRLIREPQNTVSNLAYVVVGLAILIAGRRPAASALGLAGIFLGIGSGIYHATLLPEWRMVDILGVYAVLYCLLLLGVTAAWPIQWPRVWDWTAASLIWGAAIYTGVHRNDLRWFGFKVFDSTYVFVVAVAAGGLLAALTYQKAVNRRRYFMALGGMTGCAAISFAGGIGDRFGGFWATPEFPIQGHAVWHIFGATAMLAAYEVFSAAGVDDSTLQAGYHRAE
jgi:hypothetical protein